MTTDIGQITAAATCQHCDGPIHFTRWTLSDDQWMHDRNTDRHCPTSPVAVPAPGTIVETGNP